ncbi:hypothetical protein [Mesorhizobium sp.]|uniref:hypothetical protein n=1 Tax=Mesorhizobium sp. TaxID=1871066 RepID=UPI000FE6E0F7|nr:hypothetical protein [Mesorhizobium sp.]RWO81524.1 MAG: hypothetical protein EOQ95_28220 [Mesorhizobium sp.]
MSNTVRKRPDIFEKEDLIKWLSHKVKRRSRQKEIPIAFVKYFNHLSRQFKEDDFIGDGDGWFEEIYNLLFCPIVDDCGGTQLCDEDVTAVIADTFSRAMNNHGRASAADFVAMLVNLLDLNLNGLEINRTGKAIRMASTRQFVANWGFNIDVALPKH